jgi:hypothetical protein
MKRLTVFLLTSLFLVFCSCVEQSSKATQALEKAIKDVEMQIQETDDCDDLQLLTFSILGLRTDLEKLLQDETITEGVALAFTETINQLDASLTGKYVALDCNQSAEDDDEIDTFGEDEYEDYNII